MEQPQSYVAEQFSNNISVSPVQANKTKGLYLDNYATL